MKFCQILFSVIVVLVFIIAYALYYEYATTYDINLIEIYGRREDNIVLPIAITQNFNPKKKAEKDRKYYDKLEKHANDSQNVHDSSIVKLLRKKYERLTELCKLDDSFKELQLTEMELNEMRTRTAFLQIEEAIRKLSANKAAKCRILLGEIRKGHTITSVSDSGVREDWILTLVWERIHHPENLENREKLIESLLDQFLESVKKRAPIVDATLRVLGINPVQEKYYTVCINGRVGHVLASLTLLDSDSILREPEKDETEIANLAYYKASNIVDTSLKEWKHNYKARPIHEIYQNTSELDDVEEKIVKEFEKYCRTEIEKELKKEYSGMISNAKLTEIIGKAQAGI